jgi:hypothetical protein
LHEIDLRVQEFSAIFGFDWSWIAIARRATTQDVADVDFFSRHLARGNDLVEQLPCGSDKRLT